MAAIILKHGEMPNVGDKLTQIYDGYEAEVLEVYQDFIVISNPDGKSDVAAIIRNGPNEVMPCPFCNSEAILSGCFPDGHYQVKCSKCNALIVADRRDKARAMWNLRPGCDPITGEPVAQPKQLLIWDVSRQDLSFSLLPYYTPDYHAVLAQGKTIYSLSVGQFRLIDGLIHLHMKRMQELTAEAPEMAVKAWIYDNWDQLSSLPCKKCGATPDRDCSASERELVCEQCFFKL